MSDTIINIREAVPEDVPAIEELFAEMLRGIYPDSEPEPYEDGCLGKFFRGRDKIYIAEINDYPAAYISVEVYDEYIYLDDFCVSAKYRGKGLGTALVRTAEKYAEDKNVPAAVLHVEKSNEGAYRLYKRLGYEVCADEGCRLRMKKDLM